ncbi:hypothetical protein SAMN05216357_1132 [Porphyromonadaceae bacterium KH3CP3RA]|nr:hypothetical protein SAMN05216357_1132 [Porphyromonadaceae bacterium KH3CP3RA]
MSNKNYPRIYSLSTVGIRNHYNSDYRFHPFRTDFAGDSGVGKSIIADILQLILVGEREFKSATDSSSEREARKLIVERYGYVFLNIEIDVEKYIVIGMYISATSIDPFIIQANLGLDEFEPISTPLLSKDFMQGDEIIDISNLPEKMKEKQAYAVKLSLNKYHTLLEENKILPIDLKTEGNLKNFAQIIRAFSRGKGFKNNSKWLKDFFLNDDKENLIRIRFDEQLSDIAQELRDHRENRETLEKVKIKYDKFKRLFELKQNQETKLEEYLKEKIIFHHQGKRIAESNSLKLQEEIKNTNYKIANYFSGLFAAETKQQQDRVNSLNSKLSTIEKAQQDILAYQAKESIAFQKYPELEEQYIQVLKADKLISKYGTYEELYKAHAKQLNEKSEKELYSNLVKDLNKQELLEEWKKSSWAKSANEGFEFYKKRVGEIEEEVRTLSVLKDFSDITNTKSLAHWTIYNKPSLSHEQESVLFNLNAILIEKPENIEKDIQFIPNPETFFDNLDIREKESNPDGFWVDWSGIRKFVPYIPERFFTKKNSDEIANYFKEEYNTAEQKILLLNNEKSTLDDLQKIASRHGEKAVNTFSRKDKISVYIIDKDLDITQKQLDELMAVHFNGEDIKQTKLDLGSANELKIKGEAEQNRIREEIRQNFKIEFSEEFSFAEVQNAIKKLLGQTDKLLVRKQNRVNRFQELFSSNLQGSGNPDDTDIINLRSQLSENLNKKRTKKKDLKDVKCKIEKEEVLYQETMTNYNAYPFQPINIKTEKVDQIKVDPENKWQLFDSARNAYKQAYDNIVIEYVNEKVRQRFLGFEDYLALSREVVNEIPARQLASNETDVLQQMLELLEQLNEIHNNISNRKLNLLKEIFQEVRDAVSDYVAKIYDIGFYFKGSDKQISQGFKLSSRVKQQVQFTLIVCKTQLLVC